MAATVISRTVRSTPFRDSSATWQFIVDLLTKGVTSPARAELLSVAGLAASVIADEVLTDACVLVTGDGPRTRIYCAYGEKALDGSDASEDPLGYDALAGNWAVSIPCNKADLTWISTALAKSSQRITARDAAEAFSIVEAEAQGTAGLELDVKKFLQS